MNRTIEGVKKDEIVISPEGREWRVDEVATEIIVALTDDLTGVKTRIPLAYLKREQFSIKALEGIEEIKE